MPRMLTRLYMQKASGIKDAVGTESWTKTREGVREDILFLPAKPVVRKRAAGLEVLGAEPGMTHTVDTLHLTHEQLTIPVYRKVGVAAGLG
ncbi:hypothetical protein DYB28_014213 [Aphanomyces astaci]|uniref:Uncharacterized protein n=1 Tax=Aphanomyces astaci TaxID=112090 RepID=A0A9X8DRR0_APHAT|nr:hypothetical protein DYB28_014213 [Aphanomyces astaci]